MEPDRFDDVESRILEAPERPPRPPIRRRSVAGKGGKSHKRSRSSGPRY
jgi:hypothetical protein